MSKFVSTFALAGVLALAGSSLALGAQGDHPPGPPANSDPHHHLGDGGHGHGLMLGGTVSSIDTGNRRVVVHVMHDSHHGVAPEGANVTVDVSAAHIIVADTNGDRQRNLADVAVGDRVLAVLAASKDQPLTAAVVARVLIDQGARRHHGRSNGDPKSSLTAPSSGAEPTTGPDGRPAVGLVLSGTVGSVDVAKGLVVVHVTGGHFHGHDRVSQDVTVDVSAASIAVADTNGDGQRNLVDVLSGDHVYVGVTDPANNPMSGTVAARVLLDQNAMRR